VAPKQSDATRRRQKAAPVEDAAANTAIEVLGADDVDKWVSREKFIEQYRGINQK